MLYLPREDGQGLVEYGLALILVAMVVVAIITLFGTQLSGLFSEVVQCFGPEGQRPDRCS